MLCQFLMYSNMNQPHVCYITSVVFDSLQPYGLQPTGLLCPWDSLGKNTAVGCHALLQGIFLTQGQNPRLSSLLCGEEDSLPPALPGKIPTVLYSFQAYNRATPYVYRRHAILIYSNIIDRIPCSVLHSPVTCLFDNRQLEPPGLFLNAALAPFHPEPSF